MRTATGITLCPKRGNWFSIRLTTWHVFARLLWLGVEAAREKDNEYRSLCFTFSWFPTYAWFPRAIRARR